MSIILSNKSKLFFSIVANLSVSFVSKKPKLMWDCGIVGLWDCGIVGLWDCGIIVGLLWDYCGIIVGLLWDLVYCGIVS
jgi:hypothetical protein